MIYMAIAMPVEAKPIIKKFNLKRDNSLKKFQVFKNENITLIITGVGAVKSIIATTHILTISNIKENDIFVNIGICGTGKKEKYAIGDIVLCNKIVDRNNCYSIYPDLLFTHNFKEGSIETFGEIVTDSELLKEDLVDMEASGALKAGSYFFNNSQIFCLKIISDYLDGNINSNEIENLIEDRIEEIYFWLLKIINFKYNKGINYSNTEKEVIENFILKMKFTESMKNEFMDYLEYFKICNGDIESLLSDIGNIEVKDKKEGKKILNEIRRKIVE